MALPCTPLCRHPCAILASLPLRNEPNASPSTAKPFLTPYSRASPALAQEAVERAYAKDRAGQRADASRLYRTSLDIILEALALPVPSPAGLDASHSNTARWRSDMNQWQRRVLERLRDLEGAGSAAEAATRGSPPNPLQRQLSGAAAAGQQQQRSAPPWPAAARARAGGAGAPTARHAAGPGARAGGGSRDDREFEDRVMSEVLDRSPAVAWEDVAGLTAAKQVGRTEALRR